MTTARIIGVFLMLAFAAHLWWKYGREKLADSSPIPLEDQKPVHTEPDNEGGHK
jgi:hypothetical protein